VPTLISEVIQRRSRALEAGRAALSWYSKHCDQISRDEEPEVSCFDPSTGDMIWSVRDCSVQHIDTVVQAARIAQPAWQNTLPAARAQLLNACADVLEENSEVLAEILALETGKSFTHECKGEVALPVSIFRYFAGLVHEIKGRSIQAGPTLMGFTTHHPWGVVAGIVPWNVPLMFMAYKVAAPLAVGNTVVIKMPEQATASLAMVLRLILPLLPKGVVEFVSGTGAVAGEALITHSQVDKISFTGSVETGSHIYQHVARKMLAVTLELGGKSPMVILDDCDLNKAINGIIGSMRFTRAGQSCTASSRIFVPRSQMNQYREALGGALNKLRIGDALDKRTDSGPIVTQAQQLRILRYIEKARADGLDVEEYGHIIDAELFEKGFFVRPHLVFDPEPSHPIAREEVFGPVAMIFGYDTVESAMEQANDTEFGLSASIWGRDINRCLSCAAAFRAGIIQINQNAIMLPGFSYGGIGISGVGKESSLEAMLETYMYEKTNIVNFGD
jgi:acyl-CoA reductase-like NAD-dependent aldehyde dehydrogenase